MIGRQKNSKKIKNNDKNESEEVEVSNLFI